MGDFSEIKNMYLISIEKMKRKFVPFLVLFVCILAFVNCTEQDKSPVLLKWSINTNVQDSGKFQNLITIINQANTPLENNWVIYFNQLSTRFELEEDSPLKIEHISGTYSKMYPTQFFKPLNAGDSLVVKWQTPRAYTGRSFLPDGFYIVFSENGKEKKPQTIDHKIIRNDDEYLSQAADGSKRYYPFADVVFEENLKYMASTPELADSDIIPSVKSIEINESGPDFVFSKDVSIVYDSAFSNEADVLKSTLIERFNCTVTGKKGSKIVLAKAEPFVKLNNEEHYELSVLQNEIVIKSATAHGIFNGVQTLLAMLSNKTLPTEFAQCLISDYPDLAYRGVMFDVSRNFTKKENLLNLIDYLSMYKINTLHLHMADDEGWRVEIPGLEELTQVGARRGHTLNESDRLYPAYGGGWDPQNENSSNNGYYSRQDFVDILKYAKARHITIIPEVDLPGHSRAAIVSMKARYNKYKDSDLQKAEEFLLTEPADTSKYMSVQNFNDNVVNVALASTYKFVDKVASELSQMYVDAGLNMHIFHIGGDEVPKGVWEGSPACKELMQNEKMEEARELKDYFVQQVLDICRSKNIQVAGWQEIALKPHAHEVDQRFEKDNVISYCWNTAPYRKADQIPYQLANKNFNVVLCNSGNLYLDFAYSPDFYEPGLNWGGYVNEFNPFDMQPFNVYKSIRRSINGQPLDNKDVDEEKEKLNFAARKYIMGVQGQLFSETIRNFDMVTYSLFPKSLGLAERAWNAEPAWIISQEEDDYLAAINLFNTKIGVKELPRLADMNVNFRVAAPGLKIEEGKLLANSRIKNVEIRYTTDGSEPNLNSDLWILPVDCNAKLVKAKSFYEGKESITVLLKN